MYRLLLFLRRIHVFLIFLLLEGLALYFWALSDTASGARLLAVSGGAFEGVYGAIAGVEGYLSLRTTNELLESRVEGLENELNFYRNYFGDARVDSLRAVDAFPHRYVVARVVRNSINRRENYLMVDRGWLDGIERGMAVVSLDGFAVGYVEAVSENNAICVSMLNSQFRVSGAISSTDHFGSISWPGGDPRMVRLSEVPKYADIARGDTVVTRGYSFRFPDGIRVGTIEAFETDEATASYNIDVRLGVDIAALRVVVLVKNREVLERMELEQQTLEQQSFGGSGDGA